MLQEEASFAFLSAEISKEGQEAQNVEGAHYWKGNVDKIFIEKYTGGTQDKKGRKLLEKLQWIEIYGGNLGFSIYGLWYNKCMTPSVA